MHLAIHGFPACYARSPIDMPNLDGLLFVSRQTTRWWPFDLRTGPSNTANDFRGLRHVAIASDKEDPGAANPDRDVCPFRVHRGLKAIRLFHRC